MQKSVRVLVMTAALLAGPAVAYAQSQPVSPAPVPGFNMSEQRTGTPGSSPANSGSNVGSNVGAGATASPLDNDMAPPGGPAPETARSTGPSLFGLSRDLPLTK